MVETYLALQVVQDQRTGHPPVLEGWIKGLDSLLSLKVRIRSPVFFLSLKLRIRGLIFLLSLLFRPVCLQHYSWPFLLELDHPLR